MSKDNALRGASTLFLPPHRRYNASMKKQFVILFSTIIPILTQAGTPPPGTVNIPALVERVDQGVVSIQTATVTRQRMVPRGDFEDFFKFYGIPTEKYSRQQSLGSGFVIDAEGYVLTNNHVVENATEIEVLFNDGKKTRLRAKLVGRDKKTDLALLKVKPGPFLQPLSFGDSEKVKVGETVVAIGNPFGYSHTVTAGIISAKNRVIGQGPFDNFLQTDASINFGNSGGPLFNGQGEVIGINTAISASGQGLGFAIPISQALQLVPELKVHGKALRGWMGALVVTTQYGLIVDRIVIDGPAHKAGLVAGDLIKTINNQKIIERFDAERALDTLKPGDKVVIQIERRGRMRTKSTDIAIKLGIEPNISDLPQGLL
jgi:serine protease Do